MCPEYSSLLYTLSDSARESVTGFLVTFFIRLSTVSPFFVLDFCYLILCEMLDHMNTKRHRVWKQARIGYALLSQKLQVSKRKMQMMLTLNKIAFLDKVFHLEP